MNEQQRWTLFIFLAMIVLMFTVMREGQRQQAIKEAAEKEAARIAATATPTPRGGIIAAADGTTTATLSASAPSATIDPIAAAAAEAKRIVDLLDEAERLELRNSRVAVELSTFGGRIESWKIIDPAYSVTYKHALAAGKIDPEAADFDIADYGDELIMTYPLDPTALKVPARPLELSIVGNGRNYRQFNREIWSIEHEETPGGTHVVTMTSPVIDGLRILKRITLPPDSYGAAVSVTVENLSQSNIDLDNNNLGLGITAWGGGLGDWGTYADFYDFAQTLYWADGMEIIKEDDLPTTRDDVAELDWVALGRKYTLAGMMRPKDAVFAGVRATLPEGFTPQKKHVVPFVAEVFVAPAVIGPQRRMVYEFEIFAAPKARPVLRELSVADGGQIDRHLNRAIFHDSWFNWFRALSLGMLWLLDVFHTWAGSWGVAILLLTVTMKLITHPVNHRALRINAQFQREMAKVKPELDVLKEKFKDEPMKMHQAQSALMKEHGISPFAPLKGCLPMMLQLPIFVALYQIIGKSVALRGETFLWVADLSEPDRFLPDIVGGFDLNLLPLLMVATQIVSMKLSMRASSTDANQRMMMYIMPVVMLVLLYNLASGLFVYWVATNLWQIGHTLLTNKQVDHEAEEKEAEEHATEVLIKPDGDEAAPAPKAKKAPAPAKLKSKRSRR